MVSLNNNYLTILNQQSKTTSKLGQAIERLSSGLRINSAKDGAASQATANRMTANLNANSTIAKGVQDGFSLMQTAEGGLDEINNLLQRARTLAVQAANGTLSDSDRESLNNEYLQIVDEIDNIASTTEIFGQYPLASAETTQPVNLGDTESISAKFLVEGQTYTFTSGIVSLAFIPAGAKNITITVDGLAGPEDDIQLFTRDGTHLTGTPVEGIDADIVWAKNGITNVDSMNASVITESNGFLPDAEYSADSLLEVDNYDTSIGTQLSYNGMTITYSGDEDRFEDDTTGGYNDGNIPSSENTIETLNIDVVTEDLIIMVVGSGIFTASASWDELPMPTEEIDTGTPASQTTTIIVSANYGSDVHAITIDPTPADSETLGLTGASLLSAESAGAAITTFDQALETINSYRSQYGSLTNRFESITSQLSQGFIVISDARSRITDADYAVEVSEMTKVQILQQTTTSMLAQANQQSEIVLTLLQG
ncbi:flagellin [Brenneria sp. g21c3]|uniref:flagellin N-terminal helical domain-containing protein n=1 Tax=Brenneria sp. g21c3 TaxID=3093893 RepID=UPI002EA74C8A|nr:flagellin [Brenneria sp. g21c3]